MKRRCPEPELLARFFENRLGPRTRTELLDHAADCIACRRVLATGVLRNIGPSGARIRKLLSSSEAGAVACMILVAVLVVVLWLQPHEPSSANSGSSSAPARSADSAAGPGAPEDPSLFVDPNPQAPRSPADGCRRGGVRRPPGASDRPGPDASPGRGRGRHDHGGPRQGPREGSDRPASDAEDDPR